MFVVMGCKLFACSDSVSSVVDGGRFVLGCELQAATGAKKRARGCLMRKVYGEELCLDMHGCNVTKFTREGIERYCAQLCELIDMERCDLHFWDDEGVPESERQTDPKTKGTSAVQFILTSTIVIHTLDLMSAAYVNIFSCKEFDTDEAARFTAKWFDSKDWTKHVVTRR